MKVFEPVKIGSLTLKNRIIRSATYEGMADDSGRPQMNYKQLYVQLASNNIGGLITGFNYICRDGKAMQMRQAGMGTQEKLSIDKEITDEVHKYDCKIFMQLSHAGRQTRMKEPRQKVWGVSNKISFYFGEKPHVLTTEQVFGIIENFAHVAELAKEAGFDGVQLHAAHGYLIHQFLLPDINDRTDIFKVEAGAGTGTKFLELLIAKIRGKCGASYPILIKVSGSDDNEFRNLIKFLDVQKVSAVEISYGTMDEAFNIFRGDIPIDAILKVNPIFKTDKALKKWYLKYIVLPVVRRKIKVFTPMYNLKYAVIAKQHTGIPIICVGGIRRGSEIKSIIEKQNIDFVSLSRPFICEPDFVSKLIEKEDYVSKCKNCNYCAIMCDSGEPTKCYQNRGEGEGHEIRGKSHYYRA